MSDAEVEVVVEASVVVPTALSEVCPAPFRRDFMVVHGSITQSSMSMPIMFAPLDFKTPITLNTTFCMRRSLPTGFAPS